MEEKATLKLCQVTDENDLSWHFEAIRATLKKESLLEAYTLTNGAKVSRQDYAVRLMGEGASCSLSGAWKLEGQRQHHVQVLMKHEKPLCHSLQTFKGVLKEVSKSSFEEKSMLRRKGKKQLPIKKTTILF